MNLKLDSEHQKNQENFNQANETNETNEALYKENSFVESCASENLWDVPKLILIGSSSQVRGGLCNIFETNGGVAHASACPSA